MQITLTVTAGPNEGKTFTFPGHDVFIVGRAKQAHFQLPGNDRYFSRIHFMIEVNPPRCRLMDMNSRNGTHVNGAKVKTADLHDGDEIRGGRTILRVAVREEETVVPDPVALDSTESVSIHPVAVAPPAAPVRRPAPLPLPSTLDACRVCGGSVDEPAAPHVCTTCRQSIHERPQPIAGYLLVDELGKGGMGVVYRAIREGDHAVVALKTIIPEGTPSRAEVGRFLREAEILRRLDHPNIVSFRDVGESAGQLYFAMDYVRGSDAARIVAREKALPVSRAIGLIAQLLRALEYAHDLGFVHRDLKPANLLVSEEGAREVVKLADFGLARAYQASALSGLTVMGAIAGTVAYMPPEQILDFRGVQPSGDQYSAAATLYHLLTGKLIYNLPQAISNQLMMIMQDEPVPIRDRRPDLPAGLAEAIHRALAREPENRFPNVRAFRKALGKWTHGG